MFFFFFEFHEIRVFQVKLGFETLNGLNDAAVHVHDVAAALDLTEEEVVVPRGNPDTGNSKGKPTKPSLPGESMPSYIFHQFF